MAEVERCLLHSCGKGSARGRSSLLPVLQGLLLVGDFFPVCVGEETGRKPPSQTGSLDTRDKPWTTTLETGL